MYVLRPGLKVFSIKQRAVENDFELEIPADIYGSSSTRKFLEKLGSMSYRNDCEIIANFVIILKFSENLIHKREGVMIEMLKPSV